MGDVRLPIHLDVERNDAREIKHVRIRFGAHFIAEVREEGEATWLRLVYTHHGFEADASMPGGQLEQFIEEIREAHPDAAVD